MPTLYRIPLALIVSLLCEGQVLAAQPDQKSDGPTALLLGCRAHAIDKDRLACFDKEIARFDQAEQSQQIVVINREDADAARRGLFGFRIPKLRVLESELSELSRVDAVVANVKRDRDNRITFTLEDGAKWRQIDDRAVSLRLGSGASVKIERASLGSFFATFEKFGSLRVKREH